MSDNTSSDAQFVRGIGPWQAISLVVGTMIGSGIFIVSAGIGREVDQWGPGGLLLVWVITGVMTVAGALAYAELAAMMPKAIIAFRCLALRAASVTAIVADVMTAKTPVA